MVVITDQDQYVIFKPESKLEAYIIKKTQKNYLLHTLYGIFSILEKIILQEKLYDKNNPSCILCDTDMSEAFNMWGLHITEIKHIVFKNVISIADVEDPFPSFEFQMPLKFHIIPKNSLNAKFFTLQPIFQLVMIKAGCNPNQRIFTLEEIHEFLSKYILSKQQALFDLRNPLVAFVKHDLLGQAFNVSAFHRDQASKLVLEQVIPYNQSQILPIQQHFCQHFC